LFVSCFERLELFACCSNRFMCFQLKFQSVHGFPFGLSGLFHSSIQFIFFNEFQFGYGFLICVLELLMNLDPDPWKFHESSLNQLTSIGLPSNPNVLGTS